MGARGASNLHYGNPNVFKPHTPLTISLDFLIGSNSGLSKDACGVDRTEWSVAMLGLLGILLALRGSGTGCCVWCTLTGFRVAGVRGVEFPESGSKKSMRDTGFLDDLGKRGRGKSNSHFRYANISKSHTPFSRCPACLAGSNTGLSDGVFFLGGGGNRKTVSAAEMLHLASTQLA